MNEPGRGDAQAVPTLIGQVGLNARLGTQQTHLDRRITEPLIAKENLSANAVWGEVFAGLNAKRNRQRQRLSQGGLTDGAPETQTVRRQGCQHQRRANQGSGRHPRYLIHKVHHEA